MTIEYLCNIVDQIDGIISSNPTDSQSLWSLANAFWSNAFPTGISDDDRHTVWQQVVNNRDLAHAQNGRKVLDVLRWPATGDQPTWSREAK